MKYVFSTTLALTLLASAPALADGKIDVMTQNQYLGADLTPVISATTPEEFLAAAQAALAQAAENNFPERVQALAQLIANRSSEVVGLQEVFNFTVDPDGDGPIPPQNPGPPFVDHLQQTLDALAALGEPYVPVATVQNLNISLPGFAIPELGTVTVGVTDRDVILVRADLQQGPNPAAVPVRFNSPLLGCSRPSLDGCNYNVTGTVEDTPIGDIDILRGYVGVDITIEGDVYRVVDTHLEVRQPSADPNSQLIQRAQAAQLIATLGPTTPPGVSLIVVGDINSAPEDSGTLPSPIGDLAPPYMQLVAAGYTDAWTLRPGANESNGYVQGLTCCQGDPDLPDGNLANHQSNLYERIDVIFTADVPNKVKKARVLGDRVSDKTPDSDLWPSDHGSVGAELQFE